MLLELLRGYQAFTQTCGVLRIDEARDAFLASLCHFALQSKTPPPPSTGGFVEEPSDDGPLTPQRTPQRYQIMAWGLLRITTRRTARWHKFSIPV